MWVTLKDSRKVSKLFIKQARIWNREVELYQHFPNVAWDRRRALVNLIRQAKSKDQTKNYQLRIGESDLELFEK